MKETFFSFVILLWMRVSLSCILLWKLHNPLINPHEKQEKNPYVICPVCMENESKIKIFVINSLETGLQRFKRHANLAGFQQDLRRILGVFMSV